MCVCVCDACVRTVICVLTPCKDALLPCILAICTHTRTRQTPSVSYCTNLHMLSLRNRVRSIHQSVSTQESYIESMHIT